MEEARMEEEDEASDDCFIVEPAAQELEVPTTPSASSSATLGASRTDSSKFDEEIALLLAQEPATPPATPPSPPKEAVGAKGTKEPKLSPMTEAQLAVWSLWFAREKPTKSGERNKATRNAWTGEKDEDDGEQFDFKRLCVQAVKEVGSVRSCKKALDKFSRPEFDSNGHVVLGEDGKPKRIFPFKKISLFLKGSCASCTHRCSALSCTCARASARARARQFQRVFGALCAFSLSKLINFHSGHFPAFVESRKVPIGSQQTRAENGILAAARKAEIRGVALKEF